MKKIYFVVLSGVFAIMYSCTYNELVIEELPPIEEEVSFSDEIQPIFDSKCVNCHGGSGGLYLEADVSYGNIVPSLINETIPEESEIYTTPSLTGSHYVKYSAEEAQLVLTWIEQEAQNN